MFFVCFAQAAEYDTADLFLPTRLCVLAKNGRSQANEGVLAPLSNKVRSNILERGLLRVIGTCAVDPVTAILCFARAGEID